MYIRLVKSFVRLLRVSLKQAELLTYFYAIFFLRDGCLRGVAAERGLFPGSAAQG